MMVGLVLLLALGLVAANPLNEERLRTEIEDAARDSKQLAEDLAGMLARLEVEDASEVAVEVLQEEAEVEGALKEMIERIENLAEIAEVDSESGVKTKTGEEEELRDTLIELESVAKEIEFVAATTDKKSKDNTSIEKMAKVLQDVSNRIKNVEEATKLRSPVKKPKKKKTKENLVKEDKLQALLANLLRSTDLSQLRLEDDDNNGDGEEEENEDLLADIVVDEDVEEDNDEPRRPKQLDFGLTDGGEEEAGGEDGGETCEDKQQSDRVQVCTPDFQNRDSSLQFYTKRTTQAQYCFNVTKTECTQRSQTVTKNVCTYEYKQKEVIAPARLAEIGFERHFEAFYISKCEKKLVKDGYKEKEIEVCYKENVDVPYRLPTVTERIDDFIELAAPVPEKSCRLVKYQIPEITCKDTVNKECLTAQVLEPDSVQGRVSEVVQNYRGNCQSQDLEQQTTVCTIEQKVKQPRYSQYSPHNSYRG